LVPERDEVLKALDRVLAWPEIARSPQLARFMTYIVERKLAGEEEAIKAYSIAVDVLGRPANFDPQVDPIVRVQARRLRGLLEDYYRETGRDDPVHIRLPVGRYVPEFLTPAVIGNVPQDAPIEAQGPMAPSGVGRLGQLSPSWFGLLLLALFIATLAFGLSNWEPRRAETNAVIADVPRPIVVVDEFQNLTGDARGMPMVAGLAIELVTDLEQFEDLDVRYRGQSTATPVVASLAPAGFVLSGIVRAEGDTVQYSAILTDVTSGDVVWSRSVAMDPARMAEPSALDSVSWELALVLGSPRGPLHAPVRLWLAAQSDIAGHEELYVCLELFHIYRDTGMGVDADRARACLEAIPETERQSALALAATGSLLMEGADRAVLGASGYLERSTVADTTLSRAVDLAPISGFVWEQRARYYEAIGDFDKARSAYGSAIQLNPASADALAAFARLLALRGSLDEALPLSASALKSPEPPAWYSYVPAVVALKNEDYVTAVEQGTRYAMADRELGPVLAVMASLAAGDTDVVNRYLPQILDLPSFRAAGILPQLRKRLADGQLLRDMQVALTNAGVPVGALTRPY